VCVAFKARGFAGFTPVIGFSEIYRLMFRKNFQKKWKIVGTSHNSPEYLTISRERQRKFAKDPTPETFNRRDEAA
jgi:hypothetical protein